MKYILMLTFGLYSFTATADFYSALNFYDQEQYSKAYEEFSKLAELGDKRSQFNLGIMYFKGQHVAQDINKAYAWTKLATESDLATPDEKKIHQLIANKIENIELATKAYQELSANYNAQKIINKLYPELVTESVAGKKNRVEPVKIVEPKYPRSAALKSIQGWVRVRFDIDKKGNPRNIRIIESFPGDTFVENSLRSIRQWRFETLKDENGSPTTALDQGYTLEFRLQGLELTVADEQYQALAGKAQQGDAESQFLLGYWHEKLDSLSANVNPTEMYLKSAVQGYAPAQYKLGHSLIMGNGCRKDKEKGLAWLTRAAANGQLDAQEYLAGLALQTPTR
ncbi:MAG: TonB family protein [Gammaproteobacteria bacterium]|nr:TonB family protein [Gammaproteobacteria bacterium]